MLELRQGIVGQRRLRAGAKNARVVDQKVDVLPGSFDERPPVHLVGHITGQRLHVGECTQLGRGPLKIVSTASVDD